MCGIAGYIAFKNNPSFSIRSLLKLMEHRGPDETYYIKKEHWSIGVNRLAILSPKEKNTQPLWSPDKRFCFVFNGEIYNHNSIRKELLQKKYHFKTSCDAEVLFYAYLEFGHKAFLKCQGMFACAIFDVLLKKWILVRDPVGIKPLYFINNSDGFIFASEIKPLIQFTQTSINKRVLPCYLQRRFVMGRETLFSNIFRVKPAEILEYSHNRLIKTHCYWTSRHGSPVKNRKQRERDFSYQLLKSVKMTSKADVGCGVLLSGGLDSSLIHTLSCDFIKNPSAYFFDNGYDNEERDFAHSLNQKLGSHLYTVHSKEDDFLLLPKVIRALEEPLGDSIVIPTYKLMKGISQYQKVALSGEGADELLGGYTHHFLFYILNTFQYVFPLSFLKSLVKMTPEFLLNSVFPYPGQFKKQELCKALDKIISLGLNHFIKTTDLFTNEQLQHLMPQFFKEISFSKSDYPPIKSLHDLIKFDVQNWLPNYNLLRVDKLSMAFSLEIRTPYLNIDFVDCCLNLPAQDLISCFIRKKMLRKVASNKMSFKASYRKKHPFTFKENKIYKNYREFIHDYLNESFAKAFDIDSKILFAMLKNSEKSLRAQKQVTSLLSLAVWKKEFF